MELFYGTLIKSTEGINLLLKYSDITFKLKV